MDAKPLFTRQQMRERTSIPDDVLNYWSREGVLIPAEGGAGKGQHRRFDAAEINIAAVLFQMKTLAGADVGTLREIASSLRASVAYAGALPAHAGKVLEAFSDFEWGEAPDSDPVTAFIRTADQVELLECVFTYLTLTIVPGHCGDFEEPTFLYRSTSGRWVLHAGLNFAPKESYSFVALQIGRLLGSIWLTDQDAS